MTFSEKLMVWIAMVASIVTAIWVLGLLRDGVTLNHCRYFVPVEQHPGVYTCSDHPKPVKP